MKRLALLTVLVAVCMSGTAQAATFTVTRTDDPAPGACDADCSLREAVLAANAAATADTIDLAAARYELGAELGIGPSGALEIVGEGAGLTAIDANAVDRAVQVNINGALTVRSLAIVGGRESSGAAIQASAPATVTILDSSFSDNVAVNSGGAVQMNSPGTLVIERSTFTGNSSGSEGGAVQTNSNVITTIRQSLFSNNTSSPSGRGGAIQVNGGSGAFTVSDSTFSGNRAILGGLGDADGGALAFNTPKEVLLTNVTFTGNLAQGGASTGGAIQANLPATITMRNTLVADNTATTGTNCSSAFTSGGFNLESANTCGFGAGDLVNTNPLVGPLADNGGPTMTHALLKSSPAINAGNPAKPGGSTACGLADQRGVPRPQDKRCDIGAYELARCRGTVVNRVGTSGADNLLGTTGADGFLLLAGKDKASGGKGKDGLCGGAGKDKLKGGPGRDRLDGGGGKDKLIGQGGKDLCVGGGGRDSGKSCEKARKIP